MPLRQEQPVSPGAGPPADGCKASGAAELCTADGRPLSGYLALQVPGPDGKSAGLTTPGEAASGPPQTPSRPEATVIFAGVVDLSWAEAPGADTYEVQTWRGGQWLDLPGDGVEIGFYGAGAIISGLDPESSLWFQVRAVNAEGVSDWSPMLLLNATSEYTLGRHERAANEPATGAPLIQGKAEAGATLFAETSAIEDGNGLQPSWFAYQWLSGADGAETEIAGETHLTYLLTEADEGQTIRVRVSFVDRAGYLESATSEALTIGAAATAAVNSPATGAPAITGAAQVGETLTADTSAIADTDGLTNVSYSYQWLADGADIAGATAASYTLVDADEGAAVKLRVSFTDDAGNEETLTSAATDAVTFAVQQQTANTPATGVPAISGTAQVGETLTADTSGIVDQDGLTNVAYSYQWLADDADIAGATDSTYTLVDADEGAAIKVKVSFTDDAGNDESLTSAATVSVAAAESAEPPAPPTGLTAAPSHDQVVLSWDDPQDETITGYVILRRNRATTDPGEFTELVADTGSAATTYTDHGVESDASYTYRIKAINDHGLSELSRWVRADTPSPPVPAPPTGLTAAPSHDQVVLSWDDPQDDSITGYVILRRNRATTAPGEFTELVADTGSAATTYTDDSVSADTSYTYKIRAINEHGVSELSRWARADTPAPSPANSPATGAPTIAGTVQVGETLTADTSGIADQDGLGSAAYSYQWLADDADISGATATAYTLADADEGMAIKLRVSFTDDAGNEETLTSVATDTVEARPNSPATGAPTIAGTAQVGETLTADTSGISDVDGLSSVSYSYQWLADDAAITGATATTYTLTDSEQGKTVKVRVSFTDDAGNDESLTSAATGTVEARPNSPATGAPVIVGTAQVGETLTADTSGIVDADGLSGAAFSYQWLADDADIAGATDSSYTPTDGDEGAIIKLRVSFTDDAGNEETMTSAATEPVGFAVQQQIVNTPATGRPTISGMAQVGETLTADTSGISDVDGLTNPVYHYQWIVSDGGADLVIPGAKASTYTVLAIDRMLVIKVRVRVTDDRGHVETRTSAPTAVVR